MNRSRTIVASVLMTLLLATWFAVRGAGTADATVAAAPCPGNVCTGTVTVGGHAVAYSYTQHLSSNGQLRIRFNGGAYNTSKMVSFIVQDVPQFALTGYAANIAGGAAAMTESDVNAGRTAYERRDSDGCVNCRYDQVMSLQYAGLPAGTYALSFTIIQYGSAGGRTSLPFYVDAAAPANGDESQSWPAVTQVSPAVTGMATPCADGIDNDIDFGGDCADAQCAGSVGRLPGGERCEAPEATCFDGFDNDADGAPDCLDQSCDGRLGQSPGTALCQYGNEFGAATCGDLFDNDADGYPDCVDNTFNAGAGGNANTICWKKTPTCPAEEISCSDSVDNDKDKNHSDAWDAVSTSGIDCTDYDCADTKRPGFCPANENRTLAGIDADGQCFDGDDNDLDHMIDCADEDCFGIVQQATGRICYDKELDLGTVGLAGSRYQYCANTFDDDGDHVPVGPPDDDNATDCRDTDCARRFGNCGPCPSREDFTYASCANGKDDDADGTGAGAVVDTGLDCSDADCTGKLGSLADAAQCGAENTNALCADGLDNDGDGDVDCADDGCDGRDGPDGAKCRDDEGVGVPAGRVASCGDGLDNDADGKIDCADTGCAGVGSCAGAWTTAVCTTSAMYVGSFTTNAPTVTAFLHRDARVSSIDALRFSGSSADGYSSVTIIVGSNALVTDNYPYAAPSTGCTLVNTGTSTPASGFSFTAVSGAVVQIFSTTASETTPLGPFDITLNCATPAMPAAIRAYPVSLTAAHGPGFVPEYGELEFTTTLYESTPPSILELEPEGASPTVVNVPYGVATAPETFRRIRAVPSDAAPSSGICKCEVEIDGVVSTTGADCVTPAVSYTADATLAVRARAEDGAGNIGVFPVSTQPVTINVTPVEQVPLNILSPATPFFRSEERDVQLDVRFVTGATDTFNTGFTCDVRLYSDLGTSGGQAFTVFKIVLGNTVQCIGTVTLPVLAVDGRYSVVIRDTDTDGDVATSSRKAIYYCDTIPGPLDAEPTNGCQYADFDRDGAAEGLFTNAPGSIEYTATKYACDNCIGLFNDKQEDVNVNGIGDKCEPSDQFGRCEIDRDVVCDHDAIDLSADPLAVCPPGKYCCPSPSVKTPAVLDQKCIDTWGICTLGGEICLNDAECPGGPGKCQDADPGIPGSGTSCHRDIECTGLPGTPLCLGADRCENLLYPWVQTAYGSIFSGKKIVAIDIPPADRFNATFCITAKDTILNFVSEESKKTGGGCGKIVDAAAKYARPSDSNDYSSPFGKLDIAGLRRGRYGKIVDVLPGDSSPSTSHLDDALTDRADQLDGKVFLVQGDTTIHAHVIKNGAARGAGTIVIDGGNLTILGDITYDTASSDSPDTLASLGWVIIDDGSGTKGNLYVDRGVTEISGAIYVGGKSGFWSIAPPETTSALPLTVRGLVMAREFHLGRSFKSKERGSELFEYDGRSVASPPPGFGDVAKSLPTIGQ